MTLKIETIDELCKAFDRYNEYLFKTGISQFPDFYLSQYVSDAEVFNKIAAVTGRPIENGKYHANGKSSRTFTYNGVEFLHYEGGLVCT